jgi:molecular chaperone GrpE
MLSTLERHGVRKLEPKGQKFDPNFHQAMFEVPNHRRAQQHRH